MSRKEYLRSVNQPITPAAVIQFTHENSVSMSLKLGISPEYNNVIGGTVDVNLDMLALDDLAKDAVG